MEASGVWCDRRMSISLKCNSYTYDAAKKKKKIVNECSRNKNFMMDEQSGFRKDRKYV